MPIHNNSKKSHQEHEDSGKGATYRMKILRLLRNADGPLTDRQIIDLLDVTDVNNIRPEITRLKQQGIIREVGATKCPVTGKTVRLVYISTKCSKDPGRRTRTTISLAVLRRYFDSVEAAYEEPNRPTRAAIVRQVLNDLRSLVENRDALQNHVGQKQV